MPRAPKTVEPVTGSAAFQEELTDINLWRILWLGLLGVGIDLALLACNLWQPALGIPSLSRNLVFDLVCSAVVLPIAWWIRRQPGGWPWKHGFVLGFVIVQLVVMDGYHFNLLPDIGPTSAYLLGVIIVGSVPLLRPRILIAVLTLNHVAYCGLLFSAGQDVTQTTAQFLESTAGVCIAIFVSWVLFTAKRDDFRKERLISRRNLELADANAEINEVMAIAAHDLRSPLQSLRSLLELNQANADLVPPLRASILAAGVQSCDAMSARVNQLLTAHEIEQPNRTLQLEQVDLGSRFAAVVERLRPMAEAKGVHLAVQLPREPAEARIDALALERVLENLLANAVKYSPAGGGVTVTLRAGGSGWWGEVSDEGVGVPENERGSLFQKFHRGSQRPTGGESSTGLGLFIVRTLMEAMAGSVSYAPREPRGSVFRIELPRG